jgi:hypothetical protein
MLLLFFSLQCYISSNTIGILIVLFDGMDITDIDVPSDYLLCPFSNEQQ